jgi:hypothetical protein
LDVGRKKHFWLSVSRISDPLTQTGGVFRLSPATRPA